MRGEIWQVELPSSKGHEQAGSRPGLILTEVEGNTVIALPLTTNVQTFRYPHSIEIEPSEENGLSSFSIALCYQLRVIDKARLKQRIGILEHKKLEEIKEMLKKMFKI